jgi:hypothetical protein
VADFDTVKKLATLPTRTVSLCLAGELVDEIERLERELAAAKKPTSLGEMPAKLVIGEQIKALQEQMRESTAEFHLRAMGARRWTRFWGGLPARSEHETLAAWDERVFPFYAELVAKSCVDPEMTTAQVEELTELINGSAWNELALACIDLNSGAVDIPNSAAVSALTENSEQT